MKTMKLLLPLLAVAFSATGMAQNPTAVVTLDNGAQLTFTTWTYQGVTGASLDGVGNEDGKVIVIPERVTIGGTLYDVTMVGPYAFDGSACVEVVIPATVTDIYFAAFNECMMTTVTVGEGVDSVFSGAFYGCTALATVNWNARHGHTDGSYAFGGVFDECTALTTINFGPEVEMIDGDVFFSLGGYAGLEAINIAAERLLPITASTFGYGQGGVAVGVPCGWLEAYQADQQWAALGTISADCSADTTEPVTDTVVSGDTIYITVTDTVHFYETVTVYDTVVRFVDTVFCDTLLVHDTVVVHDTIYVENQGVGGVADGTVAKVYAAGGRLVVEDAACGERLTVYDLQGRQLLVSAIGPGRFEVTLAAGAYMVRLGDGPARKVVVAR